MVTVQVMVSLEAGGHKLEDEVVVTHEQINLTVETEAEPIELDEVDDGGEEMEAYETVVLRMIEEREEEVDISLLNEWMEQILKEDEVQRIQMVEQR